MSEYLLATHGLTKQFGHHKAVDHVDLHVKKGSIYGFIGKKRSWENDIFENDKRFITTDFG